MLIQATKLMGPKSQAGSRNRRLMRSFILSLLCSTVVSAAAQELKAPVDEVSPNIGGIGVLLSATKPFVQRPFGMARLYPLTPPEINDRYLAQRAYGFPAGPA